MALKSVRINSMDCARVSGIDSSSVIDKFKKLYTNNSKKVLSPMKLWNIAINYIKLQLKSIS